VQGDLYSHPDGREAYVIRGKYCADPELQALLTAREAALAEVWEVQPRPLFWRAVDLLLRKLPDWVGRRSRRSPPPAMAQRR
jgi:hypothetical protein